MALIFIKKIRTMAERLAFLPVALLFSPALLAQKPDTAVVSATIAKYQGKSSVVSNYHHKLEIKFDQEVGHLTAASYVDMERIILTDQAAKDDKYDFADQSYFNVLEQFNAKVLIPDGKGGYKENKKYTMYSIPNKDEGTFYDDSRTIVSSFTNLTKNSIVRLTYTNVHPELNVLPFYTPDYVYSINGNYSPVQHSEFEVVVPSYVNIRFVIKGENTGMIRQSREEKNGNVIYKFTADNVPEYKHFGNVPSPLYYVPHVIPYIVSYKLPGEAKDSVLISDVAGLYKFQYKYIGNLNIKEDTAFNRLVANITKGDNTPRQKVEHIYQWVQKNMHYLGFEAGLMGWIPREADTVCKRKYGDCKDMASILMTMCRKAGVEAYFTWIGTVERPYSYEELPLPMSSNHMICSVKLDGEWVFLDGTHANLPLGAYRSDLQGKQAMIAIDAKTYKIVNIPVLPAEKNVVTDTTYLSFGPLNAENVEGHISRHFSGSEAWDLGLGMQYLKQDEREKAANKLLSRGNDNMVLENYVFNVGDNGDRKISLGADFKIRGYASRVGKDYIVNMNLLRTFESNYIDTVRRRAPFFQHLKHIDKEVVVLELPKDVKVTYLPKPAAGGSHDLWSYTISYKVEGRKLILVKEYHMNTLSVPRSQFTTNNKYVADLEEQYKESVVLTAK